MTKSPQTGAGRRNKGHGAERELAKILTEATGATWERNLDQCRDGGADLLSLDFPGVALEVKRQETLCLNKWITQAACQAGPGEIPVLAFRQSRKPWQFILSLACLDPGAPQSALAQIDLAGFVWWLRRQQTQA
jgi:hypothetical protein